MYTCKQVHTFTKQQVTIFKKCILRMVTVDEVLECA